MVVISARFISLLLTALTAGVVLGHVISRAGKMTLSGPLFVTVQNTLYRGWGKKVGAIEIGAFLSTLGASFSPKGGTQHLISARLLRFVSWACCLCGRFSSIQSTPGSAQRALTRFRQTGPRCVSAGIVSTRSVQYSPWQH